MARLNDYDNVRKDIAIRVQYDLAPDRWYILTKGDYGTEINEFDNEEKLKEHVADYKISIDRHICAYGGLFTLPATFMVDVVEHPMAMGNREVLTEAMDKLESGENVSLFFNVPGWHTDGDEITEIEPSWTTKRGWKMFRRVIELVAMFDIHHIFSDAEELFRDYQSPVVDVILPSAMKYYDNRTWGTDTDVLKQVNIFKERMVVTKHENGSYSLVTGFIWNRWVLTKLVKYTIFNRETGLPFAMYGLVQREPDVIDGCRQWGTLWNDGRTSRSEFQYSAQAMRKYWSLRERHPEWDLEAADLSAEGDVGPERLAFAIACDEAGLDYNFVEPWFHLTPRTMGGHAKITMDLLTKLIVLCGADPKMFILLQRAGDYSDYIFTVALFAPQDVWMLPYLDPWQQQILSYGVNKVEYVWDETVQANVLKDGNLEKIFEADNKKFHRNGMMKQILGSDYEDAEDFFWAEFGRAPKLLREVLLCAQQEKLSPITDFNYKTVQKFMKKLGKASMVAIKAALLSQHYNKDLSLLPIKALNVMSDAFVQSKVCDWLLNHRKASQKTLTSIALYWTLLVQEDLENMTVAQVEALVSNHRAFEEACKIENQYPDFRLLKCESDINPCRIVVNNKEAYVLDAKDPNQTILGYDTCCCQHLGGAGESAMMYGLVAQNGGFWAIRDLKDKKYRAQAEVWLGFYYNQDDVERENPIDVFVFDNIEYANDRDVTAYLEILRAWCEATEYANILMGKGYNSNNLSMFESFDGELIQPKCEYLDYVYTDARRSVWLKRNGKVLF